MKLIKIPSGQGGLGKGNDAKLAPDKVVGKLKELFLNEEGNLPVFDIDDVAVVDSNIEETNNNVFAKALDVFKSSSKAIFIGGDHSVTYPIVKAFSKQFDNPGVLIFDAHPDCENDFAPPSQEDLLNAFVNEKLIDAKNIVLVGTRNWDKNEVAFLKKHNIRMFPMKNISNEGLHDICDSVMEAVRGFDALYVSIDIDAVDPAFAPGTGYCEPGGLTSRELLYMLQRIKILKNIKAYDIMEINPSKDINEMTSKLGAKIVMELS